jgi:light-regulated signal transduction histidine kinase (bacteriophytochrome)
VNAPEPRDGSATRDALSQKERDLASLSFTSQAAHDLVGPLNQAASLVGLLLKRYRGQLDPDAEILLTHLQEAAKRMTCVAEGVRTYLGVISSESTLRSTDSGAAFTSALFMLRSQIEASNAIITAESLPEVRADASQLMTVFANLLSNSIKFRSPSEPPRIHVSAVPKGQDWLFSVKDNGIGIPPQYREPVFVAFKRLHGREYPGAGIGLALVKYIIESHQGKIWIECPEEGGTVVYFGLPAAK